MKNGCGANMRRRLKKGMTAMQPPVWIPDPTSTGLNPRIAGLICYLLGFVSGFAMLTFEKKSRFVKFHAMQSILVSTVFITANLLFSILPFIGWLIGALLAPAAFLVWIGLMLTALMGKRTRLPLIGDMAERMADQYH